MSLLQTPITILLPEQISVDHPDLQARILDGTLVLLASSLLDAIADNDTETLTRLLSAGADPRVAGVFCGTEAYPAPKSDSASVRAFAMISPLAFAIATSKLELLQPMLSTIEGLPFVACDRSLETRQIALQHPSKDFYRNIADRLTWAEIAMHAARNVVVVSLPQMALEVDNRFASGSLPAPDVSAVGYRQEVLQAVLASAAMSGDDRSAEIWRLCRRSLTCSALEVDEQFIPASAQWVVSMLEQHALPPGQPAERAQEWADIFGTVIRGNCTNDMSVYDHLALTLGQFFHEVPNTDSKSMAQVWKGNFIRRHFVDEDTPRSYRISVIWSLMRSATEADSEPGISQLLKRALADGLPPDSVFSGYPLLHLAAGFDDAALVDVLLGAGATLDRVHLVPLAREDDPEEMTALDIAVRFVAKNAEHEILAARSRQSIADAVRRFRLQAESNNGIGID